MHFVIIRNNANDEALLVYDIYSWVCCYQEKWTLVPDPKQNLKTNCPICPNIQDFGQYFHGWPTLIRIVMPEKRIFGRITNSHSSKIIPRLWCIQGDFLRRLFATQHLWFGQTKYDLYYFRKCKGWLNSTLNAYVFFLQILTTLNSSYPNWLIKENLPKTNTIYADLEFVKCFTQERFSFLGPRRPLVLPLVDPSVCPPTLKISIT